MQALRSVADGSSVTQEVLNKAIACAKYELVAASEAEGGAGIVAAGMNLIQSGQPLGVAETAKALGSVTVDSVKKASSLVLDKCDFLSERASLTLREQVAKDLLDGKAAVAAVGDLGRLPYAEELGLKV